MKLFHKLCVISIITLTSAITACKEDDTPVDLPRNIVYGEEVSVGNGKARSFIKLDDTGNPASIGFTLTKAALDNLPHEDNSYILPLPSEKTNTLYDHISLDWASHGHAPDGIYNTSHFDMHFYMINQNERAAIRQPSEEMEKLPETKFLPPTYFAQPGEGVPQMGKHWVDATTPELNGKPFTSTFIYGSYNAEVIFHEPMMAHSWLLTLPDTVMNIPQPLAFRAEGLYPQKYSVRYDEDRQLYQITLEDFKRQQP